MLEETVRSMRIARPMGLSPDGRFLLVVTDRGEEIGVRADERLRAAIRGDRPRLGQLEIDMESALRPRDIQARVRAGESLEDVAKAAGVPIEKIEPYAAPVIAERDHVAGLAQAAPVRRAGENASNRTLRTVIFERLVSRGVDVDEVSWNAWRIENRKWAVKASYASGSATREALFHYDQNGRFSVAADDDARWLIGEQSPAHGPQPGRRRRADDPDSEPTLDLNDELAIVRAVQVERIPDEDPSGTDTVDAYTPLELEEVDGVYDMVPAGQTEMDVLYDMLSSFDEDSVQIYAGLTQPIVLDSDPPASTEPEQLTLDEHFAQAHAAEAAQTEVGTFSEVGTSQSNDAPVVSPASPAPTTDAEAQASASPAADPNPTSGSGDDAPASPTRTPARPARRRGKGGRASVPSWDEIVFGAPNPKQPEQ